MRTKRKRKRKTKRKMHTLRKKQIRRVMRGGGWGLRSILGSTKSSVKPPEQIADVEEELVEEEFSYPNCVSRYGVAANTKIKIKGTRQAIEEFKGEVQVPMYYIEDDTPINPNNWSGKTSNKWYVDNGILKLNEGGA
jgi:hypothetical protein